MWGHTDAVEAVLERLMQSCSPAKAVEMAEVLATWMAELVSEGIAARPYDMHELLREGAAAIDADLARLFPLAEGSGLPGV